jgi:hypothetical protein
MINVEFLVVSHFVGLFVDWIFQWQWQALNKSKWSKDDNKKLSFIAVLTHSFIYAFLTTLVTVCLTNNWQNFMLIFLAFFVSHMIIDTRIPVKYIMRFKGLSWENIYDYQNYGFMHVGIDHRLHELVNFVLAMFV